MTSDWMFVILLPGSLGLPEDNELLRHLPVVPPGPAGQDGPRLPQPALSHQPAGRLREEVEEGRGQQAGG